MSECQATLEFFFDELGYIAREVVDSERAEALVRSATSADDIAQTIFSEIFSTRAPVLGGQPLGPELVVPVKLSGHWRDRHVYIVGRSGSGKTTLLQHLIHQDLEAGEGLAVIAPEAELVFEEILPFVPSHRVDDVVVVDPADTSRPVSLNPFHLGHGENPELKVAHLTSVFYRALGEDGSGAPRMAKILDHAISTLVEVEDTTIADLEPLVDRSEAKFRDWVLRQPISGRNRHFWSSLYPTFPKGAELPLINRMGRFLGSASVRRLLCAPGPGLDFRAAMDSGKVLLFSISDGLIGEANAQLLGQLVVAKIQLAAMSRADLAKDQRRPFTLYADEFQSFVGSAGVSYEAMLARARKYGLRLVLAHQQCGQLPQALLAEILGNVSSLVVFGVGASDARRLASELVGVTLAGPRSPTTEELLTLGVGEAIAKVGPTSFFLRTSPPPAGACGDRAREVLAASRARYGAEPSSVDDHGRINALVCPVSDDRGSLGPMGPLEPGIGQGLGWPDLSFLDGVDLGEGL